MDVFKSSKKAFGAHIGSRFKNISLVNLNLEEPLTKLVTFLADNQVYFTLKRTSMMPPHV